MSAFPTIRIIDVDQVHKLLDAFRRAGLSVDEVSLSAGTTYPDSAFQCSIARSRTEVWFARDTNRLDDVFVLLPNPPYQLAFWRWRDDYGLFDRLLDTMESFDNST